MDNSLLRELAKAIETILKDRESLPLKDIQNLENILKKVQELEEENSRDERVRKKEKLLRYIRRLGWIAYEIFKYLSGHDPH